MELIAIKGDKKGSQVIKYLEKLGGRNIGSYTGTRISAYYFIDERGFIDFLSNPPAEYTKTTLEELETKSNTVWEF